MLQSVELQKSHQEKKLEFNTGQINRIFYEFEKQIFYHIS